MKTYPVLFKSRIERRKKNLCGHLIKQNTVLNLNLSLFERNKQACFATHRPEDSEDQNGFDQLSEADSKELNDALRKAFAELPDVERRAPAFLNPMNWNRVNLKVSQDSLWTAFSQLSKAQQEQVLQNANRAKQNGGPSAFLKAYFETILKFNKQNQKQPWVLFSKHVTANRSSVLFFLSLVGSLAAFYYAAFRARAGTLQGTSYAEPVREHPTAQMAVETWPPPDEYYGRGRFLHRRYSEPTMQIKTDPRADFRALAQSADDALTQKLPRGGGSAGVRAHRSTRAVTGGRSFSLDSGVAQAIADSTETEVRNRTLAKADVSDETSLQSQTGQGVAEGHVPRMPSSRSQSHSARYASSMHVGRSHVQSAAASAHGNKGPYDVDQNVAQPGSTHAHARETTQTHASLNTNVASSSSNRGLVQTHASQHGSEFGSEPAPENLNPNYEQRAFPDWQDFHRNPKHPHKSDYINPEKPNATYFWCQTVPNECSVYKPDSKTLWVPDPLLRSLEERQPAFVTDGEVRLITFIAQNPDIRLVAKDGTTVLHDQTVLAAADLKSAVILQNAPAPVVKKLESFNVCPTGHAFFWVESNTGALSHEAQALIADQASVESPQDQAGLHVLNAADPVGLYKGLRATAENLNAGETQTVSDVKKIMNFFAGVRATLEVQNGPYSLNVSTLTKTLLIDAGFDPYPLDKMLEVYKNLKVKTMWYRDMHRLPLLCQQLEKRAHALSPELRFERCSVNFGNIVTAHTIGQNGSFDLSKAKYAVKAQMPQLKLDGVFQPLYHFSLKTKGPFCNGGLRAHEILCAAVEAHTGVDHPERLVEDIKRVCEGKG